MVLVEEEAAVVVAGVSGEIEIFVICLPGIELDMEVKVL